MAVNEAAYHENNFRLTQALGSKLNAGNMSFAPIGFDGLYLLIKQFPYPILSGGEGIETPEAGGGIGFEQAPIKTHFQGPIAMQETVAGTARQFLNDVILAGGFFDARIYEEGTPERHTASYVIERAFIQLDAPDIDWENKMQVLMLNGTIFYRFFGRRDPGNA